MAVEGSFTWGQSTATVRVGQTITVPVDADIENADGISFGSKAEITSVTFSQVTIRGLEEGSVTIPAWTYWTVPGGGPGGATVDMSTTNSFTLTVLPDEPKIATQGQWNDLANKVKEKQDALGNGDITTNLINDGAVTASKLSFATLAVYNDASTSQSVTQTYADCLSVDVSGIPTGAKFIVLFYGNFDGTSTTTATVLRAYYNGTGSTAYSQTTAWGRSVSGEAYLTKVDSDNTVKIQCRKDNSSSTSIAHRSAVCLVIG